MKHGMKISTIGGHGERITPNLVVGDYKGYACGTILDANAVKALIEQYVATLTGDNVSSSLDTLKELGDAIPTKVSQLQNDSNYLTQHQDISGKLNNSKFEALLAVLNTLLDVTLTYNEDLGTFSTEASEEPPL